MKGFLHLALGLAFFGSLLVAAHFYRSGYNWRLDVMSELGEPHFNPRAYLVACGGLALSGLLLLFYPALLHRGLAAYAPRITPVSGGLLYLAAVLLTLSGLVPGTGLASGGTHLLFAHAYGFALALATASYCCAALQLPRRYPVQRFAGIFLIVIPLAGFVSSRLFLLFGSDFLQADVFKVLRTSIWNSLALWEWIAATGTYLFLGLLLLTLPETSKR